MQRRPAASIRSKAKLLVFWEKYMCRIFYLIYLHDGFSLVSYQSLCTAIAAVVIISSLWLYLISMGSFHRFGFDVHRVLNDIFTSLSSWIWSCAVFYFIFCHIGSYIAYMHPTLETFSTSDTMLGGFLLCFLKGSDSIRFGRDSRPRDPGILHMNYKRQLSRLQSSDS